MTTVQTKIKSTAISSPQKDPSGHADILRQLKEVAEVGQRLRGDPLDSFVRVSELVNLDLVRFTNGVLQKPNTTTAPPGSVVVSRLISTIDSIQGGGDLSADRTLSLVGDVATPTPLYVYGVNGGSVRGWYPITALVGAALTKTDDANVTLTLGGTPTTALLQATSLTLGWTGLLATTRGGTGLGSYVTNDMLYASATNTLATLTTTSYGRGFLPLADAAAAQAYIGISGSFTGLANPTASVGLTAVNGVATTAMRSDAAPPLDQSIAPTWTNIHLWDRSGVGQFTFPLVVKDATVGTGMRYYANFSNYNTADLNISIAEVGATAQVQFGPSVDIPLYLGRTSTFAASPWLKLSTTANTYGNANFYPSHSFYGPMDIFHNSSYPQLNIHSNSTWTLLQLTHTGTLGSILQFNPPSGENWNLIAYINYWELGSATSGRGAWRATSSAGAITGLLYGNNTDYPSHWFYGINNGRSVMIQAGDVPGLGFYVANNPTANQFYTQMWASTGAFQMGFVNDALTVADNFLTALRSGYSVTAVQLGNTTDMASTTISLYGVLNLMTNAWHHDTDGNNRLYFGSGIQTYHKSPVTGVSTAHEFWNGSGAYIATIRADGNIDVAGGAYGYNGYTRYIQFAHGLTYGTASLDGTVGGYAGLALIDGSATYPTFMGNSSGGVGVYRQGGSTYWCWLDDGTTFTIAKALLTPTVAYSTSTTLAAGQEHSITGAATLPNLTAGQWVSIVNDSGSAITITKYTGSTTYWTANAASISTVTLAARGRMLASRNAGNTATYVSGDISGYT